MTFPPVQSIEVCVHKFSLSPDPRLWGSDLSPDLVEPDDDIHNPEVEPYRTDERRILSFTARGLMNLGCLVVLCTALLVLLYVVSFQIIKKNVSCSIISIGYPIIMYSRNHGPLNGAYMLGGTNSSGQVSSSIPSVADIGADPKL